VAMSAYSPLRERLLACAASSIESASGGIRAASAARCDDDVDTWKIP
jgi:hypothetical protein